MIKKFKINLIKLMKIEIIKKKPQLYINIDIENILIFDIVIWYYEYKKFIMII